MITLHGFGPNIGVPDPSPFVLKVDAYLRLAEIPFKRINGIQNMRTAPKGKLPFIVDNGKTIADSAFIIEHLNANYDVQLDQHLSEQQRAIGHFLCKTLEEQLYWCAMYYRWHDDKGFEQLKPKFFRGLPFPLKHIIPMVVRRGLKAALKGQGTSLHTPQEILRIAEKTLSSVEALIGDGPFLFGDKPCSADATLFAFLAQTNLAELDLPMNSFARKSAVLQRYAEHFRDTYYAEA